MLCHLVVTQTGRQQSGEAWGREEVGEGQGEQGGGMLEWERSGRKAESVQLRSGASRSAFPAQLGGS